MLRRSLPALLSASLIALLFVPRPARAEDAPKELLQQPAPPSAHSRELNRPFVEATAKVRPAVVKILNLQRRYMGGSERLVASGSGFLVSKAGHILTNRHVIQGADRVDVTLLDGRTFKNVRILSEDPGTDLAVLKVDAKADLPVAVLGDSDALDVGDWVIAIGAPFDLDSSVSVGIVSATGRSGILRGAESGEQFIQTDAALNPGNSGGPLINLDGQVVGINTAIQTGSPYSRANAGVGFAIPSNLVRTVAVSLIEKGFAQPGYLGVLSASPMPLADLTRRGIDAPGGLLVVQVAPHSPAAEAGIEQGDLLISMDGRPLKDLEALRARLATEGPNVESELVVYHDGAKKSLKVKLTAEPIYTYGLEVDTLTSKDKTQLGLPARAQGVKVTRVDPKSPAAQAEPRNRIYPSDVIVEIDAGSSRRVIHNQGDFRRVMESLQRAFRNSQNLPQAQRPLIRVILLTREGLFQAYLSRPEGR